MKYFETSLLGYEMFLHQQSVTFLLNFAGNALKMHLRGPIFKMSTHTFEINLDVSKGNRCLRQSEN